MEDKKTIYSDGNIEDKILNMLKEDRESEIVALGGAAFHNFTNARENLINWYPFNSEASVLEIGAGMGALTGLLCDKCRVVISVEQSEKRAQIIRERHKDKKNLTVYTDDIYEHTFDDKFDYILLIGVLEYVGINSTDGNPYLKLLRQIRSLLKPNGKLLLAIENQYGLKYWCGAAEDHTSIPFDGISGYNNESVTGRYYKTGVKTFSRYGLQNMLYRCGFNHNKWYYPLPDYKFPMAVFSDNYIPKPTDIDAIKFTYPMESLLIANEKELYKDILSNDVFPFFANSFFVEATFHDNRLCSVDYASLKRDYRDEYRLITSVCGERVIKQPATLLAMQHLKALEDNLSFLKKNGVLHLGYEHKQDNLLEQNYCDKERADIVFCKLIKKGDYEGAKYLLNQYLGDVRKTSTAYTSTSCNVLGLKRIVFSQEKEILSQALTDMSFCNSFYDAGNLVYFDQEWVYPDVPVEFLLYRNIKYSGVDFSVKERLYREFNIADECRCEYDEIDEIMLQNMMDSGRCNVFDPNMYHIEQTLNFKVEHQKRMLKDVQYELSKSRLELEQEQGRHNYTKQQLNVFKNEINNKNGHIEQLLEQERAYMNLLNTKGVRLLRRWWNFKEKLFPQGSKRRFLGKMLKKFLRHPIYMIKKCTPSRIKKTLHYIHNEDGAMLERRLDAATLDAGESLERMKLELFPEMPEITNISDVEKIVLPYSENPTVSIVIPVYNQFGYTYNCLKSIIKNTTDVEYEVIIGDDCSTDITQQISEIVQNITVAKTKTNVRFLRNCNNAAKLARGKYILFLNNDTQVLPNWLSSLVELIERKNDIGMVGSKLLYPDGTLQEAGGIIWGDGHAWNYGNGQSPNKSEFNYVKEVDYISGAAIMIRKSLWEEIGGFDELFNPAYCEDSDLAFEVRKHGYKLMYQPLSMVVHFEGKSNGTDLSSGVKKYQVENQIKLKKKWEQEFAKQAQTEGDLFHARERSMGKKTILVIDHYIPQIDRDAGSKTTWQYLQMFVEKGYNVKFIGDNFYQDREYASYLEQIGIEILYGPWYAKHWKEWILENQNNIDFAYLNRPHITKKYIDFIKNETNIKCIYYGHDLHFLRIRREYELNHDEKLLAESEEWKETELSIMKKAAINYYPSYIEEQEIHKIDASIPVKAITAYVYEEFREDINQDFDTREGILFVGGFGHPPNEDAVLWFAEHVYPKIREKLDVNFYIVGAKVTERVQQLAGNGIVVKGFVTEEELKQLYDSCKMVVVPLRYGAGVKGKVVEAMYYGIPIVSTSVGTEGIDGVESFVEVQNDADKFAESVVKLYNDNDILQHMSEESQAYIKEHNSIEAVWNIVKDDFS